MQADNETLSRIADAITDGERVDWNHETRQHGDLTGQIEWLRVIEAIGRPLDAPAATPTEDDLREGASVEVVPLEHWGDLQIVELIGRGGFGEVYRAHDPHLQRDVALKLMRPELGEDEATGKHFVNEARQLARVRHDNVLTIHGAEQREGRVGMWTDLLEGRTLEESLQLQGPLGAGEAESIGLDLCRALAAVHAAGLVHRDVKTSNIIREHGGRIVLLDFNSVMDSAEDGEPTGGHMPSGTPIYMAPEVLKGGEAGVRSDIYSLGVVLYRLVSGRYPVTPGSLDELRRKHDDGESVPLRDVRPDLPLPLVQVIDKALDPDPGRRYSSVGEMERALAEASQTGRQAGTGTLASRRWIYAVAAAAVVVTAWMIYLFALPGPLEVQASFFKTGEDGTVQRLAPGSRVASGDRLFLEARGSRRMHIYVLNADARGSGFVLFPLPELELQNPLPPERLHRLPAPDRAWTVTSAGDAETILVVAAAKAVPEMEHEIEQIPHAGGGGPLEFEDNGLLDQLRGIGGLSPIAENDGGSRLQQIAGDLALRSANRDDIWVWELQLANPPRN